jgi:broad specificity phosphatase PhoE
MLQVEYVGLIRHAEAENNKAERCYEVGDLAAYDRNLGRPSAFHPLTEEGTLQARQVGQWLRRHKFQFEDHVVSSYIRAMQTGYLLEIPDAQWRIDDRFSEKDGGVFHEMLPAEAKKYRKSFKNHAPEVDPFRFRPDRGHSFLDVSVIVRAAVADLRNRSLVVCHGHVMRVIDHIIMQGKHSWDMKSWREAEWQVPNGAYLEFTRRSPETDQIFDNRLWRRMSLPCEDKLGVWTEVIKPLYSNAGLLAHIQDVLGRLSVVAETD